MICSTPKKRHPKIALQKKPVKRVSIPKNIAPEDLTLDQALFLLSLPRTLGNHPKTQKVIKLGSGQFGPYVVHDGDYRSIPRSEDLFQVSLEKALELLAQEKKGRGKRMLTPLKELGTYNKHPVNIYSGKYGPYIKWDKQNYSIPKETSFENISLDDAIKFIKEKKGTKKGSVKPFSKKAIKRKIKKKRA